MILNIKNIITICSISLAIISCKNKSTKNIPSQFKNEKQHSLSENDLNILKIDESSIKKISINDDDLNDNLELKGQTIIDTAWYVKLETTDRSLIGNITKMKILDNKIFILDGRPSNLFVFAKDGRFLNKIGRKGKGPNEYSVIRDFSIDKKNKKVIIYDDIASILLYYNFDGKISKKEKFPFRFWNFYLNDNKFFFYTGLSENKHIKYVEKYNLATRDLNSTFVEKFAIPINNKQANFVAKNHFSFNSNIPTFSLGVERNVIYDLSNDKVSAMYKIDFGKLTINKDHLDSKQFRNSVFKETDNLGLALYDGNHLMSETYLYFNFKFKHNKYLNKNHVIYNRDSGNLLIWNKFISNDPYSLFKIYPLYLIPKENIFVSTIDPSALKQVAPRILDRKGYENQNHIKDLYYSVKENDNPILLFYKIKLD